MINFDFKNNHLVMGYKDNGNFRPEPYTITPEYMLNLLTEILYYYPTINFKLGNIGGRVPNIPITKDGDPAITNIRYLNKTGHEKSIIRKHLEDDVFSKTILEALDQL